MSIKRFIIMLMAFFSCGITNAQIPDTTWSKIFDGGYDDQGRTILQTTDGGYISDY